MLFRRVALIMLVACSAVPALPAQQAARSRAPDIPLSPLTVEGGGGKSAAARDAFLRGVDLVDRQQRDSAVLAFQEAARLARRATDSVTLADAQYRAGFLLWQRGKYEAAIPFLDSARAVRLVIGDNAELARVVNALGASHYQLGIYEPAIDAFEFALRLRREGTDTAGLVRTLSNIGKAYHDWEQYADAHRTLTEAIALAGTLPERASAMWLDLDALIAAAPDVRPAPTVGTQPLAKEDIALVVDRSVAAADVERAVREGAGELLESVRLFDVYEGPQVPEGKKSLAFALRFRAPDRTLSAEETAAARGAAIAAAERACGAQLR